MPMIAGLTRWLRGRPGAGVIDHAIRVPDLVGFVRGAVVTLDPAVMLVADLARPETFGSGSALTVHVGCPETQASAARRLRVVGGDAAAFATRPDRIALLTPPGPHTAGFYDVAVIGVTAMPDALRVERALRRLGHAGSVTILVGPARTITALTARIDAAVEVLGSDGRAALFVGAGDADRPVFGAEGDGAARLAGFLGHYRRVAPMIAAGEVVADLAPATIVTPPYRIVEPHPELMRDGARGYRSLGRWWGKPLQLLPARIEAYRDVRCLPGNSQQGIVLIDREDRLLPATFVRRRGYGPDAVATATEHGPTFLRPENGVRIPLGWSDRVDCRAIDDVPGLYLGYADRRFGHFLTETLARAWALPFARERKLRLLMAQGEPLLGYQLEALRLLGVAAAEIMPMRPRTSYRRLFVPTEGFRVTGSVTPVVGEGWRRIAAAAEAERPAGEAPIDRVYLSRRNAPRRVLTNEAEVEDILAARGFAVISPEALPFAAQVRLVAGASRVVGCFGSQLHLSMFMAPGARKLVIGRERFLGPDETLIAIGNGTAVDYVVEPQGRAGADASEDEDWTLDLARFERAVDRWLAG